MVDPFTGMYGVIEEIDAPNQKIVLNVDLFGQETQVEVELDQIEKSIKWLPNNKFCVII